MSDITAHRRVAARVKSARSLLRGKGSASIAIGGFIVLCWCLVAVFAPLLSPFSPSDIDHSTLGNPMPSGTHILGTDHLGRDILSRIIWGARPVLFVGTLSAAGAVLLGASIGVVAAYFGGWIDLTVSRIADIVLTFPVIILYMIVIVVFGPSILNIVAILTVTKAPIIARIVRSMVLELRDKEYVKAAKMRGETSMYIMFVEILPNTRHFLLVDFCLRIGFSIFVIGVLGFLGVGLPPPNPDWGGMVKDTYGFMSIWPHMSLIPSIAITSLVIGFNLLGIGLREKRW